MTQDLENNTLNCAQKSGRELVYLGLGSNLAQPKAQVEQAINALSALEGTQVVAVSSLYGSKPMGPQDQPDYVNAVLALETSLEPLTLLDALQAIELHSGRVRKAERWGPRTLDLDILLFGQQVIECDRLTVPHYGLKQREFVVLPLTEIAPDLVLPDNTELATLAKTIAPNGLTKLTQ